MAFVMIAITAMVSPGMTMRFPVPIMVAVGMRSDMPDFGFMAPLSAAGMVPVMIMLMALAHVATAMIFIVPVMIAGRGNSSQADSKYQQRGKCLHGT
jgi:hypothetical protein